MNKQIEGLWWQARIGYNNQNCDPEVVAKFAELIVRECMEQIHIQSRGPCGDYHGQWFESGILKHFGVEE